MFRFPLLYCLIAARTILAQSQCFYAADKTLDSVYVPCGPIDNDSPFASCCLLGDFCLSSSACFSSSTGFTYIAGCTDENYEDSTCGAQQCDKRMPFHQLKARKCQMANHARLIESQFQGIAVCDNDNWVCCQGQGQTGDRPTSDHTSECPCDSGYTTAIKSASVLTAVASLPLLADGDIAIFTTDGSGNQVTEQVALATPTNTAATSSPAGASSTTSASRTASASSAAGTSASSITAITSMTSSPSTISTGTATAGEGVVLPPPASSSLTPTSTSSPTPDKTSLKIGLGVGIPLGVICLALAGLLACLYQRRRQRSPDPYAQQDLSTAVWQGEVPSSQPGIDTAPAAAKPEMGKLSPQQSDYTYTPSIPAEKSPPTLSRSWTPSREMHVAQTPPPNYGFSSG